MKRRFAITHLAKDHVRVLTLGNQGRNHEDTREEMERKMKLYVNGGLEQVIGKRGMASLKVIEVECYDHGDATHTVFGSEHDADDQCTVIDGKCVLCDVIHADPCPECGRRAYHLPDCPSLH